MLTHFPQRYTLFLQSPNFEAMNSKKHTKGTKEKLPML